MDSPVTYPLTSSQKAIAVLADFLHSLDALALIAYVDFKSEIDDKRMLYAIRETGMRLAYLRVRFCRGEDGSARQYLSEDEPLPAELVDFSAENEEDQEEQFRTWNREAFPDDYTDIQLYRFKLLRYPDGHRGLYFCLNHLIMDGYAGIYTLQYLSRVYSAMCKGEPLPDPSPEPWKLVENDLSFYGSPRYSAGREKLLRRYETEPCFTSVNGLGSPEFVDGRRCGRKQDPTQFFAQVVRHPLPKALTDRVVEESVKRGVSPQTYYLLALRSYLGRVSGTDDVTVLCPFTCRSTLYEKSCGLNTTNSHWVRSVISDDRSLADALLELSDIQRDVMRYSKIINAEVLQCVYERFQTGGSMTYAPTWLSYFPPMEMDGDVMDLSAKFVSNGFAPTPLYMLVLPDSNKGTMSAAYWYAEGYTRPESVEALHAFLLRFLENSLNGPEQSVGSLIDASLS